MRKYKITFDYGYYWVEARVFLIFWSPLRQFQTYEDAEQYIATRKLVTYYDKNGKRL